MPAREGVAEAEGDRKSRASRDSEPARKPPTRNRQPTMGSHNGSRQTWSTTDISEAAWLVAQGIEIDGARETGRDGQFEIVFYDPEGKAADLLVRFLNSECFRYDQGRRAVLKMLAGRKRNRRPSRRRQVRDGA